MVKLTFPSRMADTTPAPLLRTGTAPLFSASQATLDELLEQIHAIEIAYAENPQVNFDGEVRQIIRASYKITVDLLDQKERRGTALLPEEIAIRQLCREELQKPELMRGILGGIFHAVGLARNVIEEIKGWFGLDSAQDRASRLLAQAGDALLPGYVSLIKGFFTTIDAFFTTNYTPAVIEVAKGQAEAAIKYQLSSKQVDKQQAAQMLEFAGFAYDGYNAAKSGGYSSLTKNQLPAALQPLYEERTGLLSASRGLQAWLGKKDDHIVVAYCGTKLTNVDMIYADIEQLSAPSILYLKAAGLLKLLAEQFRGKRFFVGGHSLGGGLTQFALTANLTADGLNYEGFAYNPAGLSLVSMNHLKAERLKRAKTCVNVYMTAYDPVSTFGAKLGYLVTLPKSSHNFHGMADLLECMSLYVRARALLTALQTTNVALEGINYNETDFLPYTKKVSLRTTDKAMYWPCFNGAYQTGTVRNAFVQATVPKELISLLQAPGTTSDSCAGIYEGYNGTGQSAAARLLLCANPAASGTGAYGSAYSIMIFGAYGLGKKQFFQQFQQAYIDSGAIYSLPRSHYETVLAAIRNPYEQEKQAWFEVLCHVVDLPGILRRYPDAQKYLEQAFIAFSNAREDLFQGMYHNRKPTTSEIISFLKSLKMLAQRHTKEVLDEAVDYRILSAAQRTSILTQLEAFCDRVIAAKS